MAGGTVAIVGGKLRIAHVLPALTKGGAERMVVDLANAQAAAGHQVSIIVGIEKDSSLLRDALIDVVTFEALVPRDGSLKRSYRLIPLWLRQREIWLESLDILHCHLTFGSVFGSLVRRRRKRGAARPAVVETYHSVGMNISALLRWFHAANASRRDGLALMAADGYWATFTNRRPLSLIRQIENGVAAPIGRSGTEAERLAYRRSIGVPDNAAQIVGTVGQLREDRRPWQFVRIFADIAAATGDGVHFVMAGDGPVRARVEAAIADHGLTDRVHLTGQVASSAMPIGIMDLYVTLAVGPTVGLAGLEAAFAGVPQIALQLREDYIPLNTNWVWSDSRLGEVARYAVNLLQDVDARNSLGIAQQQVALTRFTAPAMAEAYDNLYREALMRMDGRAPSRP